MKAFPLITFFVGVLSSILIPVRASYFQDNMPEIFQNIPNSAPATTTGCDADHGTTKANAESSWSNSGLQYALKDEWTQTPGTNCTIYSTYDLWIINDAGHKVNEQTSTISTSGNTSQIQTCPSATNPDASVPIYETDGSGVVTGCIDPVELASRDTCDASTDEQMFADTGLSCLAKDDGSRCPVKETITIESVSGTGGSLGLYKYDSSIGSDPDCYGATAFTPQIVDPPTDNYCEVFGNLTMCNENPSDVCDDNGNCNTGCGSVNFGDGTQFVCIADDKDSDGVPDYSDIDIDGDGVRNEDDSDWDGDGINDPDYSSGRSGSSGSAGSATGTGTGSGSVGSGTAVDTSGIEEGLENLLEDGDFSTDGFNNAVDSGETDLDNKIQAFNENDKLQFKNILDEIGIENSLGVTGVFTSGCSATFAIPLTGESLDVCESANKAKPFLYVIFAFSTFVFCSRQIINTIRGSE